jgi:hypothetical protein
MIYGIKYIKRVVVKSRNKNTEMFILTFFSPIVVLFFGYIGQ